jgi:hypothetical protein
MSTIIIMFMLPIGIIIYSFDKKISRQNNKMFNEYIEKIRHSNLSLKDNLIKSKTS